MHTTDGLSVVVHENWFEIEQDEWQNTDKRRISEKTKTKCMKKPNKSYNLSTDEMQKIKRACKVITEHSQIHVIKRLPVDRKNGLFYETNYRNKLLRTSVKYIGIDMLNNTIPLEDQWLKINFEKHTEFWDKILKLKENETVEVPTVVEILYKRLIYLKLIKVRQYYTINLGEINVWYFRWHQCLII